MAAPMSGLWRTNSTAYITFDRSLANSPKNSCTLSGSFERAMPSARKRSIKSEAEVCRTRQSVWPMMAISFPLFTAQASAIERMVLLCGPVSSTMRSIALACAVKGGKEIAVIGHTDCRVKQTSASELIDRLRALGIDRSKLPDNVQEFFGLFASERSNVMKAVEFEIGRAHV